VRLELAVLGFLEGERERPASCAGAEPHEAAATQVDVRSVRRGVLGADAAVQTVGGHDRIRAGGGVVALNIDFERERDASLLASVLEDVEQPRASDAAKAVAARPHLVPANVDLHVVPVVERVEDPLCCLVVGRLKVAQGVV
jgi:hypothetical protein